MRQNSGRNELQRSGAVRQVCTLGGQSFSPLIPKRKKKYSGLVTAHISRREFVVPFRDGDSGNILFGLNWILLRPSRATHRHGETRRLRHHLNISHHCLHTAFETSLPLLAILNLPNKKKTNLTNYSAATCDYFGS